MERALSLDKPRLTLNALKNQTQRDEQVGYMQILSGCMQGIRNPRAHDHLLADTPSRAFVLLLMADHLFTVIEAADGSDTR